MSNITKATTTTPATAEEVKAQLLGMQGAGNENVTAKERTTPIIRIAQPSGDVVKPGSATYIQGLTMGQWFNAVTEEPLGDSITFIPCHVRFSFIEWAPGNKFAGEHTLDSPEAAKAKLNDRKLRLPNGNELKKTAHHYGIWVKDDNTWEPVMIPMSGTALTASSKWQSAILDKLTISTENGDVGNLPRFSHMHTISTEGANGPSGMYYRPSFSVLGETSDNPELFEAALAFYTSIEKGNSSTTASYEEAKTESTTTTEVI